MLDMLGLRVSTRHERDHVEWNSWICEAVVRQGKLGHLDELCVCKQREAKGPNTKRSRTQREAHKGNRAVS